MRWLLLNHNLRHRGTWHRAWGIARELVRRGESVELWTAAPNHYYRAISETFQGVQILETPSWAPLAGADDGWGPLDIACRAGRASVVPCDLVYAFAHPPNNFLPAWLLKKIRRRRLLYDWCDWYAGGIFPKREELRRAGLGDPREKIFYPWLERREIALERAMPRLADGVTVISKKLRALALELGCRPEKILLLPNGADQAKYIPRDELSCRAELNLSPRGDFLAYVANYHPDEEFFLLALAHAAAIRPALRLLKTGPPFSSRLLSNLNLSEHIIDFGRLPEAQLSLLFGAADALALPLENNPSNIARLPFKFTDYLAAGRPLVTCRVGDVAHYFDHAAATIGTIGLAAEPTPETYGEALAAIFSSDFDRAALGRNALTFAETEFAWPHLVDKLLRFSQTI